MHFCDKCGSVMVAKEERGKAFMVCRKCGHKGREVEQLSIQEKVKHKPKEEGVVVLEKSEEALPKTKAVCPECGNKEAVWWLQQTRSSDEAPTLFLRCTKCSHSWREYG